MRFILSLLLVSTATFAADMSKKDEATSYEVPGGDIFGFTSGTDVGNKGDKAVAFEYSARAGRHDGTYYSGTLKNQYSFTVAENLQLALSPFVTHHHLKNVTGYFDKNALQFDGLSGEVLYRVLSRSSANRFALTFSAEARYARVDGATGVRINGQGLELKAFGDVDLGNNLYAAMNLNYAFGSQKGLLPADVTVNGSSTNSSLALTKKFGDFFFGVEMRHLRAYDGMSLNTSLGSATFFGPTMLWAIDKSTTLNMVYTPQIAGRSAFSSTNLDLDNFEKHQFRIKLVKGF